MRAMAMRSSWDRSLPGNDPYLSAARMHICQGCDRLVQDERAWQARKQGGDRACMRCRNCQLPVSARLALPADGGASCDWMVG